MVLVEVLVLLGLVVVGWVWLGWVYWVGLGFHDSFQALYPIPFCCELMFGLHQLELDLGLVAIWVGLGFIHSTWVLETSWGVFCCVSGVIVSLLVVMYLSDTNLSCG